MKQRQNTPGEDKKRKKKQTEKDDILDRLEETIEKAKKILGKYRAKNDCSYCD